MDSILAGIRTALDSESLSPEILDNAIKNTSRTYKQLRENIDILISDDVQLKAGRDDFIVHCHSRILGHDQAEELVGRISLAALVGKRVFIPQMGRRILFPSLSQVSGRDELAGFLHFYATLAPLIDSGAIVTYPLALTMNPPEQEMVEKAVLDKAVLDAIRESGLSHNVTQVSGVKGLDGLEGADLDAYLAAEGALDQMRIVRYLRGGIPWPGLSSTNCVDALMAAYFAFEPRGRNQKFYRAAILTSLEFPDSASLTAEEMAEVRKSDEFEKWRHDFSSALDLGDDVMENGGTLDEAAEAIRNALQPAAHHVRQEVAKSSFLSSILDEAKDLTLATVAKASFMGPPSSADLLADSAMSAAKVVGRAAHELIDAQSAEPLRQHFQLFANPLPRTQHAEKGTPSWVALDRSDHQVSY